VSEKKPTTTTMIDRHRVPSGLENESIGGEVMRRQPTPKSDRRRGVIDDPCGR